MFLENCTSMWHHVNSCDGVLAIVHENRLLVQGISYREERGRTRAARAGTRTSAAQRTGPYVIKPLVDRTAHYRAEHCSTVRSISWISILLER
jgi:hypothetical protein